MIEIIGLRFKPAGKIYYFDPNGRKIRRGTGIIVETIRGMEYGVCEIANKTVEEDQAFMPVRKIIRIANDKDLETLEKNKEREKEAFGICLEKIREHGLGMKLIDVELTFDTTKIIFYFTAEGRVDFRELVKELASVFRMRIELRQIGVRDESKFLNGIGMCGRTLCCATFLSEFQPVSMKMAKDQSLSLNPSKISGICGRLMCCLKYEEETYEELSKGMPDVGDIIKVHDGQGEVLSVSTLRRTLRAAIRKNQHEPPSINTYEADEITIIKKAEMPEDGDRYTRRSRS
ncbi:MAG: stage 0 sporulation family protein [Defluviitaleaceae bacterium]|nr:stage 0 sporulation family protein [Defluviitaleaceae bacterium]